MTGQLKRLFDESFLTLCFKTAEKFLDVVNSSKNTDHFDLYLHMIISGIYAGIWAT